jgi:hypothetical protein
VGGGGGIAGNVYINGNVGIRTNAPVATLDVSGAIRARSEIQIGADNAFQIRRSTEGGKALLIEHYSGPYANVCFINNFAGRTTRVGIDTTSPASTLDVSGTVNTSDNIDCGGRIIVNGAIDQTSGGGLYSYMTLSRSGGGANSSFINWYTANGTRLGFMGNGPTSGNVGTGDMQLYFQGGTTGLVITGDTDKKLTVRGPIGFSYTTVPTFTTSQIGYTISSDISSLTINNNSYSVLSSLASVPIGVWLVQYLVSYYNVLGNASNTRLKHIIGTTSGGSQISSNNVISFTVNDYVSATQSIIYRNTAVSTFYFGMSMNGAAASISTYTSEGGYFRATRIA